MKSDEKIMDVVAWYLHSGSSAHKYFYSATNNEARGSFVDMYV
jgi:hypothetical protein